MFFFIFVIGTIVYKLILHTIALVLACLIRNVKVDALNDSRETVAIIYSSTLLLLFATVVTIINHSSRELIDIMWSIEFFTVSMIHIGVTFIPKVCLIIQSRTHAAVLIPAVLYSS